MSLLLALFSIGLTAKMIAEVGKDVTKIPAREQIQDDTRNGTFSVVQDFEQILYICDVKRKKHNSSVAVLPYNGYTKCLKYIRDHPLTSIPEDEERFIEHYNRVLSKEIGARQEEYDKRYFEMKDEVEALMSAGVNYEVVEFKHIDVLTDMEYVDQKVNEIYNNTFFGDMAIKKPKIIQGGSSSSFREIWALKVPATMKIHLKDYYKVCSQRCGFIEI
ncbi:MAG: hypothetical protein IKE95_03060 [Methanobrevibacter sp.]|nr:hypothetical protein [Methanobrevibacter sp.]